MKHFGLIVQPFFNQKATSKQTNIVLQSISNIYVPVGVQVWDITYTLTSIVQRSSLGKYGTYL